MSTTASIIVLLKFYASKLNSPFIMYASFIDYLKRYAQHNAEEQPDLIKYLGNPEPALNKELEKLASIKQVAIIDTDPKKKQIFVTGFLVSQFSKRYKEIEANPTVPFPTVADLPKNMPDGIVVSGDYSDLLFSLLKKQQSKEDTNLYAIVVPNNLPSVIFPGNVPISVLVVASLEKIRNLLQKEEYHDYYLKKLRMSNSGKDISVKNFFSQFVKNPQGALHSLQTSSDCFYFWGQLCFFIKQDYEKVKDFTQEDINVLESVAIAEIVTSYYKNEAQKNQQRENALHTVQQLLQKPPFYFTMDAILKFTDSKGVPLQGQYTEDDLKTFLHKETTDAEESDLPNLLVFKIENGTRYFIYKDKIFPLILRLCNDAHDTITENISQEWFLRLKNFEKLPEMTDDKAFNARLENEVRKMSPILYAILNATFLSVLHLELTKANKIGVGSNIFVGETLLPYSTLLMINRADLLADAKIKLPFWYTIPIFSWIVSLFAKKPKTKKNKKSQKEKDAYSKKLREEQEEYERKQAQEVAKTSKKPISKRDSLVEAAKKVESHFVPEGSTLERELNSYKKQWNRMLSKQAYMNLTDDVNSLIRDYTRKVVKTISGQSFTSDRIQNLAETLCKTPGMQKITDHEALFMYVQLYMVYLVKNM